MIPDEVKTLYASMNKTLLFAARERHQLVYSYIKAMVNLYGVFTPDKLIEIFNSQNSDFIDSKEFFRIYYKFIARDQSFYLCEGYIISDYFENDDELYELLAKTKNKQYYIPDKSQFLNYADDTYFEVTPQLNALKEYIEKNIINDEDEDVVGDLIDDIQLVCSMEEPIQSVLDEFNRRDINFKSMQQVKDLMPLVTDVYNNTRIWSNCGHTPTEIYDKVERPMMRTANMPVNVMINCRAAVEKIGRNDPCPCGSGKKYKKCCGNLR